jgi:hypothetical protein
MGALQESDPWIAEERRPLQESEGKQRAWGAGSKERHKPINAREEVGGIPIAVILTESEDDGLQDLPVRWVVRHPGGQGG